MKIQRFAPHGAKECPLSPAYLEHAAASENVWGAWHRLSGRFSDLARGNNPSLLRSEYEGRPRKTAGGEK